jgi:hypothetical protein
MCTCYSKLQGPHIINKNNNKKDAPNKKVKKRLPSIMLHVLLFLFDHSQLSLPNFMVHAIKKNNKNKRAAQNKKT